MGQETRLRLTVPRALSPELKLIVPLKGVRGTIQNGAGFLSMATLTSGQTQLIVQGLRGNLQLSWQTSAAQPARVMEVQGQILVRIMGPDEFQTEARLRVPSFGQPIESFQVRLPPGHALVSQEVPEYTATVLQRESTEHAASQIVEVKLAEKTEGPVLVTLETVLAQPQGDLETPTELAGFEVLGTLRQSGEIAITVVGQWSLDWERGGQVQRVGELVDSPWPDPLDATFEYYRQPCSLRVRVWPMETHISVQPTYVLHVDQYHTSIRALLHYKVQGAATSFLRVEMPGWQIQSVESQGRIDPNRLSMGRVDPLVVPLLHVSPGEFDVELQARRPNAPGASQLVLQLPHPQALDIAPARVAIVPARNVQLTPRAKEMPYLTPTALPADLLPPEEKSGALCYLDRGDQTSSQLSFDMAAAAPDAFGGRSRPAARQSYRG